MKGVIWVLDQGYVSALVHELRSPLGGIIGHAEIIKDGLVGEVNEKQAHSLDLIIGEAERLTQLVTDLLDATKNDFSLLVEEVDYLSIVRSVIELLAPTCQAKHIGMRVKCGNRKKLPMRVDPSRIKQILVNLISNAIKWTPEGATICIKVTCLGDEVETHVIDRGPGISKEDIVKLFKPFIQLDRQKVGTGLGLVVAKQLVEAHHGKIGVISKEGKGSDFYFSIPK